MADISDITTISGALFWPFEYQNLCRYCPIQRYNSTFQEISRTSESGLMTVEATRRLGETGARTADNIR